MDAPVADLWWVQCTRSMSIEAAHSGITTVPLGQLTWNMRCGRAISECESRVIVWFCWGEWSVAFGLGSSSCLGRTRQGNSTQEDEYRSKFARLLEHGKVWAF